MPLTFLTQAERERYQQIPLPLSETDLRQFFHLTIADQLFVKSFHGEVNRLSIAFQLGLIRFLGYLPTQWQWQSDTQILDFLSGQIGLAHLPNTILEQYGHREKTQTEHLQRILKYLTYRKWQPMDELFFESWLIEQGMAHDNERILLDQLCQKLHGQKILRPAIGTLERMVAGIGERLHEETYRRLSLLWNQERHQTLDKLLEIDQEKKVTLHRWLCQEPTHNSPKAINQTIERITYLHHLGVPTWNVSAISLNRRKRLTAIARNNSNHYLLRMAPNKRYSILVCFLWETLLNTTDAVLTMFDDYWEHIVNGAKRSLENYQLSVIQSQNQAVQTLTKAVEMIVDDSIDDHQLRILIFQHLPKEQLQKALEMAGGNHPSLRHNHLFYLLNYYACLRQFIPNLLKTIAFEAAFNKDNFSKALSLVIELQTGKKKKLPLEVSTDFITPSWAKWVLEKTPPQIVQRPYELCVLSVLRDRLLSGDIFVRLSRKYADFNSFLIGNESWKDKKMEYCQQLGGTTTTQRIEERMNELENLLKPLDDLLKAGIDIRLDEGVLVVPPLLAEDIPVSAKALQAHINQRLPKVNLVEMIREVDSWLHFSKELQPITAETKRNQTRNEDHTTLLYAALFAQACNLSVSDLARSSDLDYSSLWWVGNNYLIEENLKRANDTLVNYHHKQWLCGYWGGGTLSSSDGQRFPTSGKIRNAKALPRYFGYGKGVTFYTHTSDQYSQYGTKVIASTERDATYVLDEIVGNETDLPILEHTTDTAGYTDLIFALFDLLGMQFSPRIRDIKDQSLCKIKGKEWNYPALKFTTTVNPEYIKRHWDELLKVAASIKTGTVTASMLISKLQAYPRQNNLMYVLQAYGQLVKTVFIAKYLLSLPLRRKINTQLIKGEQLHYLRLYLWFGGDGIIRKKQEPQQQVTAKALNLLTNIVMVWNTVYQQAIIQQLRQEGNPIDEADFEHLSPAPFEHINRLGKYSFGGEIKVGENGLRPLRNPKT